MSVKLLVDAVAEDYPSLPTDKLAVLDISGLHAFLMKVIKNGKLNLFLADIKTSLADEEYRNRANLMWDNILDGKDGLWLDFHDEGIEKQLAYIVDWNHEDDSFGVFGIAKWAADGHTEIKQAVDDDTKRQWAADVELLLDSLMYFLAKPKTKVYTSRVGGNAGRRSKHHARPPVAGIKVVVIDGVRLVHRPDGTVEYRVKKGGWHPARHAVASHLRHLKSGKIITIKAHERGDATLGYVRYRVSPSKIYWEGLGI